MRFISSKTFFLPGPHKETKSGRTSGSHATPGDRPLPRCRYPRVFSKGFRHTCECHGAGGQDRQQALSLQVEEMLLLHLKKLLLDGNLLRGQLGDGDDTTAVSKRPQVQTHWNSH